MFRPTAQKEATRGLYRICYGVDQAVATSILSRPERLDVLTPVMATEFRHAMQLAQDDAKVRAMLVTGPGKGFCEGVDMAALGGMSATGKVEASMR